MLYKYIVSKVIFLYYCFILLFYILSFIIYKKILSIYYFLRKQKELLGQLNIYNIYNICKIYVYTHTLHTLYVYNVPPRLIP